MKKITVAAVALLVMLLITMLLPYADSSSDLRDVVLAEESGNDELSDVGIVSGKLISRDFGAEGTVIFTADDSKTYEAVVIKEDNGRYSKKLPPGQYSAKARSTDVEEVSYPEPIVVEAGSTIDGIDFKFVNTYTLTGTVRYGNLDLSGVKVSLSREGDDTRSTVTNSEGYYQFNNLRGGTWTILFEKEGFKDVKSEINMETNPYFNTQMYRAGLPGINGFIPGYDFQHSMMIIGLIGMVVMIAFSLILRLYASKNPSLILEDDNTEEKKDNSG